MCCNDIMDKEPYDIYGYEQAIARDALKLYKRSSSHDKIIRSEKYTKVGAGFLLKIDAYGGVGGYVCEANFEK